MFLSLSNISSLCLYPQHMLSHSRSREQLDHGVRKGRAFAGYSTSLLFSNTLTKQGLFLSPTKQLVTSGAPFIELKSQGVSDFPSGGDIPLEPPAPASAQSPPSEATVDCPPETRSPWRGPLESHCFLGPLALWLALPRSQDL